MSRSKKLDKKKIVEKLRTTPIVEVVCKQTGVPRSTYYRWRKEDSEFAEACDEALFESSSRINDMAESQLIQAIKDKNMTAIIFWLKHHHKAYETRVSVDANVKHESEELTPAQAEIVNRALKFLAEANNESGQK